MKKQKKNKKKSRNILLIFLFTFIFTFCLISTAFFLRVSSPYFQTMQEFDQSLFVSSDNSQLLKGESITGKFKAKHSQLGIVAVRFNNKKKIVDDTLVFRIREKDSAHWYYENIYKTDQFQNDQLFPFGFPKILSSHNKEFEFEIESLRGTQKNAVTLSSKDPSVIAYYNFTPQTLLTSNFEIIEFIQKKFISMLSPLEVIFLVISPLLLFIFTKYFFITDIKRIGILLLLLVTFLYIFTLGIFLPGNNVSNSSITVALSIVWISFILFFRVESKVWFGMSALLLIVVSSILIIFKRPDIADRGAMLAYIFLIIGFVQSLIEYVFPKYFTRNILDFLSLFINIKKVKYYLKRFS
jgi:hypothetical protein